MAADRRRRGLGLTLGREALRHCGYVHTGRSGLLTRERERARCRSRFLLRLEPFTLVSLEVPHEKISRLLMTC